MKNLKESAITINITTNENNIPQKIKWSAADGGISNADAKAMILSFWDSNAQTAMRIDLWDAETTVDDMKRFFHQTLLTMADSFEKATGENKICEDMRDFCHHFADKMNILPPLS
jgi:gliding motility-associated protein GldC